MKSDFYQIILDDTSENIKQIVSCSNKAKDMIIKSLEKGDRTKKCTSNDIIDFLKGCHFRIETSDDKGDTVHNLVFKIPKKEKK